MPSLFTELRRRNVFKVAVAYAIVAWILIEISATVFPIVKLPEWTVTLVTMLLLLGFPIAMIISWAFELTPEGLKPTHEVEQTESITQVTGRKIDFVIIGVLVLALGYVVLENYILQDSEEVPVVEESAPVEEAPSVSEADLVTPEPVPAEEARPVLPNSVAVLPFENLSPDPDNAYFAAGIHEEVLNHLTKLSALNVIARTSMMQYADGDKAIPQIAEELNVETVMEGSVRYADDRVLVTAQLIDPLTNAHLWSESYNREFADIFAIQADIAMNIANALEAEFSLEEQASIEEIPTDSPEAYRLYLAALDSIGPGSSNELSVTYATQALEADPEFAEAYLLRGWARTFVMGSTVAASQAELEDRLSELEHLVVEDIEHAQAIDPNLIGIYLLRARIHRQNWRGALALEAYQRGYELNPNDPFSTLQVWTIQVLPGKS